MSVSKIRLQAFRNFNSKLLEFSKDTTVILGPNASGKTNILESLFLLSSGKSFKAKVEEEMVNYDSEIARVKGRVKNNDGQSDLEIVLTRGVIDVGTQRPERVARKKLLVNGVSKRLIDFAGSFKVTLFAPSDLGIVTESPSIRRNFLDTVISQVDREYRRALLSYEKGLRQRNKLLYRIREEGLPRSQLLYWSHLLIKNGDYISRTREEFIQFVNSFESSEFKLKFLLEYDKSAISETRLDEYKEEEVAAGTTLVGPHRDDFIFKVANKKKERELASFGSRGEQRMGVLWLKLAELSYIETKSQEKPTLLLDDIFSELDHEHRDIVFKVTKSQQTIITTADPHSIESFGKLEKIKLKG